MQIGNQPFSGNHGIESFSWTDFNRNGLGIQGNVLLFLGIKIYKAHRRNLVFARPERANRIADVFLSSYGGRSSRDGVQNQGVVGHKACRQIQLGGLKKFDISRTDDSKMETD